MRHRRGCIVAPSVEAKRLGIKTGMRVQEGERLCPGLVVLPPSPNLYRSIHVALRQVLREYSDVVVPKSIDEFIVNLEGYPALAMGTHAIAREIKQRIKDEIGESLTVSIGIGPNRFLAKTAAGLHKPDGLDEINATNVEPIYAGMQLTDLCGIADRNAMRLQAQGIYTVTDFYRADVRTLRAAFQAITGYHWYLRLKGWEVDDVEFGRHSFGNSFALPQPLTTPEELAPILTKLVQKTGQRMRHGGYQCRGVHVAMSYRDGGHWHKGIALKSAINDSREMYRLAYRLLCASPYRKPVTILAESVFNLEEGGAQQLGLFEDTTRQQDLVDALDIINSTWGATTSSRQVG